MPAVGSMALLLALSAAVALAGQVRTTPVEKVLSLLEDMKTKVEDEGKEEAKTYDEFACFCKDTTKSKSESVTKAQDEIDSLSVDIEENMATTATKESDLAERKKKHEKLSAELEENKARCLKKMTEFEAAMPDLVKAASSVRKALDALKAAKPGAFLELGQAVNESLALADALSVVDAAKQKAVWAFIQKGIDPDDAEYKFHSGEIISTLEDLFKEATDKRDKVQEEWDDEKKACEDLQKELTEKMEKNEKSMETLKEDISKLREEIAQDKDSLVDEESLLKEDSGYLKDLTTRCEASAKLWDQRSRARAEELAALAGALAVLKDGENSVKELDKKVNKRALLLQPAHAREKQGNTTQAVATNAINATNATNATSVNASNAGVPAGAVGGRPGANASAKSAKAPSFLQVAGRSRGRGLAVATAAAMLGRGERRARNRTSALLIREGSRLRSGLLSSLASRVLADPFAKVKTLIQGLIERLLHEATQEATKKGFCDEELGKAKNNRDFRFADTDKLAAELGRLEAKEGTLEAQIEELGKEIEDGWKKLNETTDLRKEEKEENLKTIEMAKDGVKAVGDAISILSGFYKKAAKAKLLLQASPVDEDTDGPGFTGTYKGQQEGSGGILGMLDVIKSDFARTVRSTQQEEKAAAEEFVEFDRTSRSDIAGKETSEVLKGQELKSTKNAITDTIEDMETAQGLLDTALKTIEELKPMCIDTGMSFAERKEKREEEIAALKEALCFLDPEKVEEECK